MLAASQADSSSLTKRFNFVSRSSIADEARTIGRRGGVHGTPPAIDQNGIGSPCSLSAVRVVAPVALRPFVRLSRSAGFAANTGLASRSANDCLARSALPSALVSS
jgi:hypothetical protein